MHLMHLIHTYIRLTPSMSQKDIIDSRWVRKAERLVRRPSTNMNESANEGSHLDQLETKVAGIIEILQVLTNVVASLTVLCIADNREMNNQNGKIIGEPSETKPTSLEVAPVRNRRSSKLGRPLLEVFRELEKQGLMIPLEPRPFPNPVPPYLNLNQYCFFHQEKGHDTDNCTRLRHEVQNLIDAHKIPNPEKK